MLYLGEERVGELLRWGELIDAMEKALAAFSLGRVLQPVRNMLTIEEGKRYFGIMPAVAEDVMGAKLVSFYPGNAGTRLPTHLAVVLLFLLIFILQNEQKVDIAYLGAHGHLPLGVALLLAAVCGVLLTILAGAARMAQLHNVARRHRRRTARRGVDQRHFAEDAVLR